MPVRCLSRNWCWAPFFLRGRQRLAGGQPVASVSEPGSICKALVGHPWRANSSSRRTSWDQTVRLHPTCLRDGAPSSTTGPSASAPAPPGCNGLSCNTSLSRKAPASHGKTRTACCTFQFGCHWIRSHTASCVSAVHAMPRSKFGRQERGGEDGGEPTRSPPGWLECSPAARPRMRTRLHLGVARYGDTRYAQTHPSSAHEDEGWRRRSE